MKQVVLTRSTNTDKVELLDIESDKDKAAQRVSFYIYHWEARHVSATMISAETPILCESAKCFIWFESLDYFNRERLP